jgi:hypothetical protein
VEASLFLDCPPRIPRWFHVEASEEPPISNSKIACSRDRVAVSVLTNSSRFFIPLLHPQNEGKSAL